MQSARRDRIRLDPGVLAKRSAALGARLRDLGLRAKNTDCRVTINARSDAEGRRIYRQLNSASGETRVRATLAIASPPSGNSSASDNPVDALRGLNFSPFASRVVSAWAQTKRRCETGYGMNRTIGWKRWIPLNRVGGGSAGLRSSITRTAGALVALYLTGCLALAWWWDFEPEQFAVRDNATREAERSNRQVVTGYTTTATLIRLAETLLDKRGGYLSNDLFPPGVWMDNVPNWEFGVLTQVRDTARAYRIDFARSQSQSREDPDLAQAEGKFFFDNSSWVFPPSESEYAMERACSGRTWSACPTPPSRTPSSTRGRTTCSNGCRAWKPGWAACRSGCRPASASGS